MTIQTKPHSLRRQGAKIARFGGRRLAAEVCLRDEIAADFDDPASFFAVTVVVASHRRCC